MNKQAVIIATLVPLTLIVGLTVLNKENKPAVKVQQFSTIQTEGPVQSVAENIAQEEVVNPVPQAINQPIIVEEQPVVVEQRLTDQEIIELFKSKAVFENPNRGNGYAILVGIYMQPNDHWLHICLNKVFNDYSDKFKPSTIEATIQKLNPMMESFDRALEYQQICRQPENYL